MLQALQKIPFLKLLVALCIGIVWQWYSAASFQIIIILTCFAGIGLFIFSFLSNYKKFQLRWLQGIFIGLLLANIGSALVYLKNIQHHPLYFEKFYTDSSWVMATLQEPLVKKPHSYKAIATIQAIKKHNSWHNSTGKILLYFKSNIDSSSLSYGSQIVFKKRLQPIQNTGNPGSFDYKRYCLFQGITAQIFLEKDDFIILPTVHTSVFRSTIFQIRQSVLHTLERFMVSPKELGVAQALLIGYRDNLDKNLLQSYTNAGVVHIIAISGLHLGMIYGLVLWLLQPFRQNRIYIIIKPIILLCVLWGFSFVAGAAPSIVRSAIMFSFLVVSESIGRQPNAYNSLAASAFCLLAYNPFTLWDVGFQLSYAAVLGIMLFEKPIEHLVYFSHTWLNKFWRLNAITISAQILTLPFVLYHFHQFANLFFITNLIAVPLSGIILYGELALLLFNFWNPVAVFIGKILARLIGLLNMFIEQANLISFSVTNSISITLLQAILLFFIPLFLLLWVQKARSIFFIFLLTCVTGLVISQAIAFIQWQQQKKIIVYNVPKYTAIDFIHGTQVSFLGDEEVANNVSLLNFYVSPSRIQHHLKQPQQFVFTDTLNKLVNWNGHWVLLLKQPFHSMSYVNNKKINIVVLSQTAKVSFKELSSYFPQATFVFDASNSWWKTEQWKKECRQLHLHFHSIPDKGAFIFQP